MKAPPQRFRDEIHQDLQSLHLEVLRQFQIQQSEIAAMLKHWAEHDHLTQRVQDLEDENRKLRHLY